MAVVVLAAPARAVTDPGCSTMAVVQRAGEVSYGLGRTFLRQNSDSVWSNTRGLIRDQDYALDRVHGILRLRIEPVPGETLWVQACGLLQPPAFEYHRMSYRAVGAGSDSAVDSLAAAPVSRPATAGSMAAEPAGASLTLTGNKTIAIEFGSSQDAFLRQSLDLSVSGTLAPGVELTGALSDRNTPLTATGSTRDLQSLDRLLIELKAPQGGAALGDVGLSLDRGEFGRLERRLQGARAEWNGGLIQGVAAAASAQGEFQTIQLYGTEGLQGPYYLPGPGGATVVAVVAGSEVVTLDGQRMTRGESADYSMDYDRGAVTFTNRRPISSASRITVDYQAAVSRFRRNFAATAANTTHGPWETHFAFATESDDRGRPLTAALDESDRLALQAAGDSAWRALGAGVVVGRGDYVVVGDSLNAHYAYAGTDSGGYQVVFANVGAGHGEYTDSTTAEGRVAYRFVGPRNGSFEVGRLLPMPDSRQLWDLGTGLHLGALALDLEGAMSRYDQNTFSSLDDEGDVGGAGSAKLAWEVGAPGWSGAKLGASAQYRQVEPRFEPFTRLERPFEQEDWGLPVGADLEHQRRAEGSIYFRPSPSGELRGDFGQLETPTGFSSQRKEAIWSYTGVLITRASWQRADGEQADRKFPDGGRERTTGELGLVLPSLAPLVRADWDERWTPSDSGRVGDRYREVAGEVRTGSASSWRLQAGYTFRRSGALGVDGWSDHDDARTASFGFQTPEPRAWSSSLQWQRRTVQELSGGASVAPGVAPATSSDLASAHLRGANARRGLSAVLGLEVTSEGEPERTRQLVIVGDGLGAYDSLGNFVGTGRGNRDLVITNTGGLRLTSRASTSTHLSWQPPGDGLWQSSRVEATLETEARRTGALLATDAVLSPLSALTDSALSRGTVTQRLEADLLPSSRFIAMTFRVERRVSSDRSFTNFAQTQDIRQATLRWRARPTAAWTTEVEGKAIRSATSLGLAAEIGRAVREAGLTGRLGFSPSAAFRLALVGDGSWARREGSTDPLSTALTFGPELGLTLFRQGRLELTSRKTVLQGEPLSADLPFGDPLGTVLLESTGRFDYRLRELTTVGISMTSRNREGRRVETEGRAEVRAFF
jgi:hypothetical protein